MELSDFTKRRRETYSKAFNRAFPYCFEIEFCGGERGGSRSDRVYECLEEFRAVCGFGDEVSDTNLRLVSNATCPDLWSWLQYGNSQRDVLVIYTRDEHTAVLLKLAAKV